MMWAILRVEVLEARMVLSGQMESHSRNNFYTPARTVTQVFFVTLGMAYSVLRHVVVLLNHMTTFGRETAVSTHGMWMFMYII